MIGHLGTEYSTGQCGNMGKRLVPMGFIGVGIIIPSIKRNRYGNFQVLDTEKNTKVVITATLTPVSETLHRPAHQCPQVRHSSDVHPRNRT
jgi:hypothetical protein